jgi:hypothetical protein
MAGQEGTSSPTGIASHVQQSENNLQSAAVVHSAPGAVPDARPLPDTPSPSWQGYSSAKWSGDTLVVDTIGVRDDTWIDWNGSVITEAAKVREEIRRPDFGHLEIRVTVDDPKAYTKPWSVTLKQRIVVDAELIDEICLENERFVELMGLPLQSQK